jgi:hypothetical protein
MPSPYRETLGSGRLDDRALLDIMHAMVEYTYRVLRLPGSTSRETARRLVAEHAEYGGWELDRLRLYPDGSRRIRLRRKIIRAVRTF